MNKQEILLKIEQDIVEERHNYKGPHCCLTMDSELRYKGTVLKYNSYYREYGIKIPESTGCTLMDYCIACGIKMPLSLREKWFDMLEYDYGLNSPCEDDKDKVPQEFWTDEWWKKRGL
jgi:hypothetical protein